MSNPPTLPQESPVTVINPNQIVVLLNGIFANVDTVMTFQVTIEKMRDGNPSIWDTVFDFGQVTGVSVPANITKTFTDAYGYELTYKVPVEGIYRWNAWVASEDRQPDIANEHFYSYFTSTFSYFINDTTIDICDPDCNNVYPGACDMRWIDGELREYFCLRGFPVTVYLITKYNPIYVFGEDPVKTFGASFVTRAIWEPSPENKNYGKWEKTSEEPLLLHLHKATVRKQIREVLLTAGIFSPLTVELPDPQVTKEERWRRELQEGDMLRTNFNNIHYEIDGVKQEPDFMYFLNKYVYQITVRPRLVANENLGDMQSVTEAEEIRQQHDTEIAVEAEKILF